MSSPPSMPRRTQAARQYVRMLGTRVLIQVTRMMKQSCERYSPE